eukprot:scaffold16926_cov59-Attheya_sp.AAC.2
MSTSFQGEEEQWIEADGNGNVAEQEEDILGSLFADPDPTDVFFFEFGSNIKIPLRGIKAENGQTLHSTGLTLWRASHLLCNYLVSHTKEIVENKTILELGAGLGLCGILAHKLGTRSVVLTDGDTDTLAEMRHNVLINTNQTTEKQDGSKISTITCRQLRWGRNVDTFFEQQKQVQTAINERWNGYDIIMGSDIIYVEEIIEPLFQTVVTLLGKDGKFLLAYARRNVSIDLVFACAQRHDLTWTVNCPDNNGEGIFIFERRLSL